jgi:hypothetical protein
MCSFPGPPGPRGPTRSPRRARGWASARGAKTSVRLSTDRSATPAVPLTRLCCTPRMRLSCPTQDSNLRTLSSLRPQGRWGNGGDVGSRRTADDACRPGPPPARTPLGLESPVRTAVMLPTSPEGDRHSLGRASHMGVKLWSDGGRDFPPLSLQPTPSRPGRGGTGGDAKRLPRFESWSCHQRHDQRRHGHHPRPATQPAGPTFPPLSLPQTPCGRGGGVSLTDGGVGPRFGRPPRGGFGCWWM